MLYLFGAKKMQTSAKKACFQFAECSFSYAEDTTFPRNFQGFMEKILEKGGGDNKFSDVMRACHKYMTTYY